MVGMYKTKIPGAQPVFAKALLSAGAAAVQLAGYIAEKEAVCRIGAAVGAAT
jgi:hypothetical protein